MSETKKNHIVTGAFGYSGQYIARRLLELDHEVRTLTDSPRRPNPFGNRIRAVPYHFDQPEKLTANLRGADVLYNTYWVRFNHRLFNHFEAVQNTLRLFDAAQAAGVRRIVHVSITNPYLDSPLEYFNGKAQLEKYLMNTGLSYAILRPAVLFGKEDILLNNIAWALRRFPVFGVPGHGRYQLQPIHVDDLAALAVDQGAKDKNVIIDAIGPETFTYQELVRTIGELIGHPRPVLHLPDWAVYLISRGIDHFTGDRMLTRAEIKGLKANLLVTHSPPVGKTKLTDWVKENADTLGMKYASELARRRNRQKAYGEL